MISRYEHSAAPLPTIPVEEYRSLTNRAQSLFTTLAFYQPILARVHTVRRGTVELSIAVASDNVFELLEIPISFPAPDPGERQNAAPLLLSQTAWRKYFDSDPDIVGRVLQVAGQPAHVAGVNSDEYWRLPGRFDAWLLEDGPGVAGLPPHSMGFVLAHLSSVSNLGAVCDGACLRRMNTEVTMLSNAPRCRRDNLSSPTF